MNVSKRTKGYQGMNTTNSNQPKLPAASSTTASTTAPSTPNSTPMSPPTSTVAQPKKLEVTHVKLTNYEISFVLVDLILQDAFDIEYLAAAVMEADPGALLESKHSNEATAVIEAILNFDMAPAALDHYDDMLEKQAANSKKAEEKKEEAKSK